MFGIWDTDVNSSAKSIGIFDTGFFFEENGNVLDRKVSLIDRGLDLRTFTELRIGFCFRETQDLIISHSFLGNNDFLGTIDNKIAAKIVFTLGVVLEGFLIYSMEMTLF